MAKYGKKASDKIKQALHEQKRGTLQSEQSGKKVKILKQAIAIGLAQARRAGAKQTAHSLWKIATAILYKGKRKPCRPGITTMNSMNIVTLSENYHKLTSLIYLGKIQ